MTLFSSLLPPKAISCGFSILYAGGNVFTHLFVLQRKRSFTVFCYLAFLLPSKYVWLSPSCLSVKTFGLEKTCLFMSSRLERAGGLRGGAQPPPPNLQRGGPFEEGYEGDFARDFLLRDSNSRDCTKAKR